MTNRILLGLLTTALLAGCKDPTSLKTVKVSLQNADVFHYPAASGDEDGARLLVQASHFTVSEIRRNAQTNWVATYIYQPADGFAGTDYAEIEIFTGSDGASAPTHLRRVGFRFDVHD